MRILIPIARDCSVLCIRDFSAHAMSLLTSWRRIAWLSMEFWISLDFSGERENPWKSWAYPERYDPLNYCYYYKKSMKKCYIDLINIYINCSFKLTVKSFEFLASLPRKVLPPQLLLLQKEINFRIKKRYIDLINNYILNCIFKLAVKSFEFLARLVRNWMNLSA